MEERIQAILARIEASSLSPDEKIKLYGIVSEGLKASIWPSLLSAMPPERLAEFTKQPAKASISSYLALIEEATKDASVFAEIEKTMNGLLDEVDSVLTEEHI